MGDLGDKISMKSKTEFFLGCVNGRERCDFCELGRNLEPQLFSTGELVCASSLFNCHQSISCRASVASLEKDNILIKIWDLFVTTFSSFPAIVICRGAMVPLHGRVEMQPFGPGRPERPFNLVHAMCQCGVDPSEEPVETVTLTHRDREASGGA